MANVAFNPNTDFEEESQNPSFNPSTDFQEEQSFPQEAWQATKDAIGGLSKGAIDAVKGIAVQGGALNRAMGFPSVQSGLDTASNYLPGNPNDAIYQVGQYVPAILGGGKLAFDIGRAALPLAATGANAAGNALVNIPGISQLLGRNVTKATDALADKTKNVLADLYDNPDFANASQNMSDNVFGKENQTISNIIHQNYLKKLEEGKQKYSDALSEVGDNPLPYEPIENSLDQIMSSSSGGIQKNINNSLANYIDNPTVNAAHSLQSDLGVAIRKLYQRAPQERDADLIDSLTDARNALRDYISQNAGDNYQDASNFWRNNVVPYQENKMISKVATQGKVDNATKLVNSLANGELEDADKQSLNTIASHMTDDQKEQMLLPFLKGSKANPLITTSGDVNPDVLLNSINGLKFQGLDQFVTPKMQNYFNVLNDAKNNIAAQDAISKKARWIGGGALALSPLSYELRHLF